MDAICSIPSFQFLKPEVSPSHGWILRAVSATEASRSFESCHGFLVEVKLFCGLLDPVFSEEDIFPFVTRKRMKISQSN
jgi:hypothetical protein